MIRYHGDRWDIDTDSDIDDKLHDTISCPMYIRRISTPIPIIEYVGDVGARRGEARQRTRGSAARRGREAEELSQSVRQGEGRGRSKGLGAMRDR